MEGKNVVAGNGACDRELLRMFKNDFTKIPMLSREEEIAVARRARAGDQAAADLLVESNIRFVIHVVFKYWYPGLPLMDLISEGCLGLLQSVKMFDPERGVRLVTYAHDAIAHRVYDATWEHYRNKHASLDDKAYDNEDETTLKDLLAASGPGADETAAGRQVHRALAVLDDRERRIIILRFWLDLEIDEIAVKLDCSGSRVRQLLNGALPKLRWSMSGASSRSRQKSPEPVFMAECQA